MDLSQSDCGDLDMDLPDLGMSPCSSQKDMFTSFSQCSSTTNDTTIQPGQGSVVLPRGVFKIDLDDPTVRLSLKLLVNASPTLGYDFLQSIVSIKQ